LREAENGQELCNRILQRAGLKVNLISGVEEARYAYLGALSNKTHLKGQNLVVDIGGGSTEFIWGEDGKFEEAISLPIGSAKLTEKFGLQGAVNSGTVEEAGVHFRSFLDDIKQRLPSGIDHMIGTAGTFTTLAAVQFQVEKYKRDVDGSKLTAAQIEAILHRLGKLEAKDRLDMPGIDPGREDVILGGAVIAEEILRWFGMDEIIISDRGLRFGVVLGEVGF
jgi:exopolyphosphatase/guanosine-5'-triphosphate,3'-diphosphate pyrophosphatase